MKQIVLLLFIPLAALLIRCGNPFDTGDGTSPNFRPGFTTTTSVCARTSYAQQIKALGPVGYWRLNDTTTTALDYSGTGNNGTYQAGVTLSQPGVISGDSDTSAIFASASSQFVRIPVSTSLNNGSIKTVIVWFNTVATNVNIYSTGDTINNTYQVWVTPAGKASVWSNGAQIDGNVTNDGAWHMAVGVWNGAGVSIYVDGVFKNSGALTIPGTAGKETQIGTQCSGANSTACSTFFNGGIDDVAVFNQVLSASQILTLYQSIANPTCI